MTISNRSCPANAMVASLLYADPAAAIEWLSRAFGFRELYRYVDADGRVTNAQMSLGDAWIMIGGPIPTAPERNRDAATRIMIIVDDVDAHHERAKAAGARILEPPRDEIFGERQYSAEDAEGRAWRFAQHVADVDPRDWGARPNNQAV